MLYATPVDHVLRAFWFDRSGFDKDTFYVYVFVLPLYVPATHVHFNFGDRLRRGIGEAWSVADPEVRDVLLDCIQRDGLPFLKTISRPSHLAAFLQDRGAESDPYSTEAVAYSKAMEGDYSEAQSVLDSLVARLDANVLWQAEMQARAVQLRDKLERHPQQALDLLSGWEKQTVKNLGVI